MIVLVGYFAIGFLVTLSVIVTQMITTGLKNWPPLWRLVIRIFVFIVLWPFLLWESFELFEILEKYMP